MIEKIDLKKFYEDFDEPFSFIKNEYFIDEYSIKKIAHIMFNKNMKKEKINLDKFNFPDNIVEVYWYYIDEGYLNEGVWDFIGKVKYKNKFKYVYFISGCDSTGFDCRGLMKLYISKSLKRLLRKAVVDDDMRTYNIKEKIDELIKMYKKSKTI